MAGDDNHEIFIGKMVAIPVIFIIVLCSALLPWLLAKSPRSRIVMAFAICLSAGAMLGIGLLHAIPEAREVWEEYDGGHDHLAHGGDDHDGHSVASAPALIPVTASDAPALLANGAFTTSRPGRLLASIAPSTVAILPRDGTTVDGGDGTSTGGDGTSTGGDGGGSHSDGTDHTDGDDHSDHDHDHDHDHDGDGHADGDGHDHGVGHGESAHSHGLAYVELIAGLTVLFLFSFEHLILAYLVSRKSSHLAHCDGHGHGGGSGHAHEDEGHSHGGHGCKSDAADGHVHESIEMVPSTSSPSPTAEEVAAVSAVGQAASINGDGSQALTLKTDAATTDDITPEQALDEDNDGDAAATDPETKKHLESLKLAGDAIVATLAITLHCIFNGLALGADNSTAAAFWTFFGATVGHKFVDGFAVGITIWRGKLSLVFTIIVLIMVAGATPVGIAIGYGVSRIGAPLARAIVMSISAGSFIFIACFEMMPAGFKSQKYIIWKIFFMFVGFAIVAIIAKWA